MSSEWREVPFSEEVLVNPAVRLNRGTVYRLVETALTDYDEAIRLKSNYAGAYFNRENTKSTLGRVDEARQAFEKAHDLAQEPKRPASSPWRNRRC